MLWLYLTISLHEIEEMSSWNGEALRVELAAVADVDIDLLAFTAFSTEEIDVILDPAKDVTKSNPDVPCRRPCRRP